MKPRILILGGTTEARELAQRLASRTDCETTLSLAGRTLAPAEQPVPVRRGGFGGADGLAQFLRTQQIAALVDCTHPYAALIARNAIAAAALAHTPLIVLQRPPWTRTDADRWIDVDDAEDAVRALGPAARNVFLSVGRQELAPFGAAPQHRYLIRSVDPVEPPLNVPHARYILARGPFRESDERLLLASNSIEAIVAKNSGGTATYGKIAAARALGIPVYMFRRPDAGPATRVASVDAAMGWLIHTLGLAEPRGV